MSIRPTNTKAIHRDSFGSALGPWFQFGRNVKPVFLERYWHHISFMFATGVLNEDLLLGFGVLKFMLGMTVRCSSSKTHLIKLVSPAAPSE